MYDDDAVLISPQLTLYTHVLSDTYKTRRAGFVVLHKQIKKNKKKICSKCGYDGSGERHTTCPNEVEGKRCKGEWSITVDPEVTYQVLINEIPERMEELVIENMEMINECITRGIFTRNLTNCKTRYGSDCEYVGLCREGKKDGLVCMKE